MSKRKPIHLEQRGGKGNRQRIWEVIRKHRDSFTLSFVADEAGVNYGTAQTYFRGLKKAGVIANKGEMRRNKQTCQLLHLVQDYGVEAPKFCRDGSLSRTGEGTEAMWRTLRMLGSVTAKQLAAYASAAVEVKETTAHSYLKWLVKAGYVQHTDSRPRRYSLVKAKVTGPRAPQVQRVGQVYDPNNATVVYTQSAEDLL